MTTQLIARIDREAGFQLVVVEPCKSLRECAGNALSHPLDRKTEEILFRTAERVWALYAEATTTDTHGEGVDLERKAAKICEKQREVKEGVMRVIKVVFEGKTTYQQ